MTTPKPATAQTAQADQLHAAVRDARRLLEGAARAGRGNLVPAPAGSWLADQALILATALLTGESRCCPHLASGPRVLHAVAWKPGYLVCTACRPLLVADAEEDSTCDRCRQHADQLHTGITACGPVLLGYGLCPPCAASASTPSR